MLFLFLKFEFSLAVDECADGLGAEGVGEVTDRAEVEDDDGDLVVHAEAESGGVHDAEAIFETMLEGNGFETFSFRIFPRVRAVDSIDLGCFEDDIGSHFAGAKGGGGVGGKEGAACAAGEDDDGSFIELVLGFAPDEGLGHVFHFDGRHDGAFHTDVGERAFQGEGVHDRGQHSNVIGSGTIHATGGGGGSAPEVSATDYDSEFQTGINRFFDFIGNALDDFRRDIVC